ncbi:hypothetical protein [Streptomyces sp. NPDC047725]|uniref:hypothetical protein n=1 Tax=Streptomyces sp. NPDC047725 TaxID=3365487 RepID=UPI0037235A47
MRITLLHRLNTAGQRCFPLVINGTHTPRGATAAATMAADRRVRAGFDLDGDFFLHPAAAGLDGRPFMMLGAESTHSPNSRTTDWPEAWKRLNGWKRWLTVAGADTSPSQTCRIWPGSWACRTLPYRCPENAGGA